MNRDDINLAIIIGVNTALGELDVLQNVGSNGSNISRYDYNYDARGVRAALQEKIEADPVKTLMFSYDPSNQLTGEAVTGGKADEAYTANYEYDSAGNRTRYEKTDAQGSTLTRSSNNKLNQTTATRTTANGVGSTSGLSYDEAGNIAQVASTSGSSEYAFDDANRLKAVVSKTAAGVNQSKTEFVYDGASRLRVSKTFAWSNGVWVSQGEKKRVYDGMGTVQERDGQGALVALYVRGASYGGGVGGLLARVFDVGTSFMHYDGRGNVVQLTDASGAVSGKYTYDAYGNTLSLTGGAAGLNPYRFSTKEAVGSLVYYGLRFYSPSLGKWINRDPIHETNNTNLYNFVENSPSNKVDVHGLWTFCGGVGVSGFFSAGLGYSGGVALKLCAGRNDCGDWSWGAQASRDFAVGVGTGPGGLGGGLGVVGVGEFSPDAQTTSDLTGCGPQLAVDLGRGKLGGVNVSQGNVGTPCAYTSVGASIPTPWSVGQGGMIGGGESCATQLFGGGATACKAGGCKGNGPNPHIPPLE